MSGIKNAIIVSLILVIFVSVIAAGCGTKATATAPANSPPLTPGNTTSPTIINQVIDTKDAYDMIQSNQGNSDFMIIDVRTPEEFNTGHLSNAAMIDFYSPDFQTKISELDRNKKYLVYCRTANRSGQAAKIMKDLGFREVYDMAGGINQWVAAGYPTVAG